METWEAVGELLQERWRTSKRLAVALDPEELNKALFAAGVPEFHKAIMAYLRGDQTKIADYLCMHPLSRGEEAELAWALNDRARPPQKGRPTSLRQLKRTAYADFAVLFFKIWKEANAARGINDRGHREKMKQHACAFAVEWLGGSEADIEADIEAVRELVDRPASRRNIINTAKITL